MREGTVGIEVPIVNRICRPMTNTLPSEDARSSRTLKCESATRGQPKDSDMLHDSQGSLQGHETTIQSPLRFSDIPLGRQITPADSVTDPASGRFGTELARVQCNTEKNPGAVVEPEHTKTRGMRRLLGSCFGYSRKSDTSSESLVLPPRLQTNTAKLNTPSSQGWHKALKLSRRPSEHEFSSLPAQALDAIPQTESDLLKCIDGLPDPSPHTGELCEDALAVEEFAPTTPCSYLRIGSRMRRRLLANDGEDTTAQVDERYNALTAAQSPFITSEEAIYSTPVNSSPASNENAFKVSRNEVRLRLRGGAHPFGRRSKRSHFKAVFREIHALALKSMGLASRLPISKRESSPPTTCTLDLEESSLDLPRFTLTEPHSPNAASASLRNHITARCSVTDEHGVPRQGLPVRQTIRPKNLRQPESWNSDRDGPFLRQRGGYFQDERPKIVRRMRLPNRPEPRGQAGDDLDSISELDLECQESAPIGNMVV